jgi:putative spermidine/putrescine transport system ATP-binding protein
MPTSQNPQPSTAIAPPAHSLPIRIESLSKRYGSVRALDDVSLDIRAGEFLTLLGPSGSGKTSLLMALAGFVRPDAGRIRFGDAEVTLRPPHKRNIGMVFQNYALFPHMSVLENVTYPLRLRGMKLTRAEERANAVLDMMQLQGFGSRRIDQLSGGQQQRVALARAIVFEPPVLLMDEPLSALDKKLREAMQVEIRRIHERVGATTVYVTHDQREALALSDRVAVLNHGRLLQVDTPGRIYHHPETLFVADFLGDSYFLPVDAAGSKVTLAGKLLKLASRPSPSAAGLFLVIRPEKLEVFAGRVPEAYNILSGTVRHRLFLGEAVVLFVELEQGREISVKLLSQHRLMDPLPGVGELIRLGLHPQDVILLPAESEAPMP